MSSAFPNDTFRNVEVKRTRSGRVVLPPLAGWTGERVVSSLDDGAPLQYVRPTLDARAEYLLSNNMLERFKKQQLIQEPFKVEEQSFPIAVASDCSRKSTQPKQKSLKTGQRKSVAHRTKKGGLSKSQSKLVCVELPETSQKKRIKMTVHCHLSDKLDNLDIHHGIKKNCKLPSHNDSNPSGVHKELFEEDIVGRKQCTSTMKHSRNQDCEEKVNYMHKDLSNQPVYLNINSAETADVINKIVLTDKNHSQPSNAKNGGRAVQHVSVSSYEADDEGSNEVGMCLEDSSSHSGNLSQHDEVSHCSRTTNMQKCIPDRRQGMSRGNKATDKHQSSQNIRIVGKNKECTSDDVFEETSKITGSVQESRQNEIVADKSCNKTETKCSRNEIHNIMKVKKCCDGKKYSDTIKVGKDSLEIGRHRKSISGMHPEVVVKMARTEPKRPEAAKLDQLVNLHSDDSCSSDDGKGHEGCVDSSQISIQKSPLKTGIPFQSQFNGGSSVVSGLSNDCMRGLCKEMHTTDKLKVSSVFDPEGKRVFYYTLEHSVPDDACALIEVEKQRNIQEVTTVPDAESVNQKINLQKFDEKDMFAESDTNHSSKVFSPISKDSNAVTSSVKSKLESVSEPRKQNSSAVHRSSSPEEAEMHKKNNRSGLLRTVLPVCLVQKLPLSYVSSNMCSEIDQSRKYHSKSKIPISKNYVVSETVTKNTKNLGRQFNSMQTCEEESDCKTSGQNMSEGDEEPSQHVGRNQNSCVSSRENNSNKSFVKPTTRVTRKPKKSKKYFSKSLSKVVDVSSNHKTSPRFENNSLKENVIRRQSHVYEHRSTSGLPKKSLFNPMRSQLIYDDASATNVGLHGSKTIVSREGNCSQKRRNRSSLDENCFQSEQYSGKNAACITESSKKRKVEQCEKQHAASGLEMDVSPECCQPSAADSLSERSQSSTGAVKGSACAGENISTDTGDKISDSNQHINNTFAVPCTEKCENSNDKSGRGQNQISNMNSLKHQLDCNGCNSCCHVKNLGKNKLKVLSPVCGAIPSQNYHVLETGVVDSNYQIFVKEHGHRHHYKQKLDRAFLPICNFKDSHSQKRRDLSKNIPLHCSSVENDVSNYVSASTSVPSKVPSRTPETDFSYQFKVRPEKSKDFKNNSVIQSDFDNNANGLHCNSVESDIGYVYTSTPISTKVLPRTSEPDDLGYQCKVRSERCKNFKHNSVVNYNDTVDTFCHNGEHEGTGNKCTPENFATNIPMSCSLHDGSCGNVQQNLSNHLHGETNARGANQDEKSKKLRNEGKKVNGFSFNHSANKNTVCDTFKEKNKKRSSFALMMRKKSLESETDKDVLTVKERHVPKQCTKCEGSVGNTSTVSTSNERSLRAQDCNDYKKQQKGTNKKSQSVPSDSYFNTSDLESSSSDASVSHSYFSEDDPVLNQKKSNHSSADGDPQGSVLHQIFTRSYGENCQTVINQDGKNESLLGISSEHRSDPDAELNSSSRTKNHKHTIKKSDALQKMSSSQKSPAAEVKLKTKEHARTETEKKRKAVYRMQTQHNEDEGSKSNADEDVILQFEQYAVDESESSLSANESSHSFKVTSSCGRKAVHSKKHSHNKNIRKDEADSFLLAQEQLRPVKQIEQKTLSKDSGTNRRKDNNRSGKAHKDNIFIITELQKDEHDDFRICMEDVENYYLSDEGSDIVYKNY